MTPKESDLVHIAAILPGYPAHCAWVVQTYGFCRHTPPEGTAPVRLVAPWTDISGANLSDTNLSRANLTGAKLTGANLSRAKLTGAKLTGANLSGTDISGADISGARLSGADISGADLSRADISGTNLSRANLSRAVGIRCAGPVGVEGRMIYGVAHEGGAMIQAGCFWGTVPEMIAAVNARYADGSGRSRYRAAYLAAVEWVSGV